MFREKCGLPISTYFSAVKLKWLLDNKPEIRAKADAGKDLGIGPGMGRGLGTGIGLGIGIGI